MSSGSWRVSLRNIFLGLFLASTLVMVVLIVQGQSIREAFAQVNSSTAGDPSAPQPEKNSDGMGLTVIGSVVTSITSLIGFIVTTVITWRKEKRDASLAEVERKKIEIELEKSKLELEALKKEAKKKDERKRRKPNE